MKFESCYVQNATAYCMCAVEDLKNETTSGPEVTVFRFLVSRISPIRKVFGSLRELYTYIMCRAHSVEDWSWVLFQLGIRIYCNKFVKLFVELIYF